LYGSVFGEVDKEVEIESNEIYDLFTKINPVVSFKWNLTGYTYVLAYVSLFESTC